MVITFCTLLHTLFSNLPILCINNITIVYSSCMSRAILTPNVNLQFPLLGKGQPQTDKYRYPHAFHALKGSMSLWRGTPQHKAKYTDLDSLANLLLFALHKRGTSDL